MRTLALLLLLVSPTAARADATLTVLAAASLKAPLQASAADFEKAHPGVKLAITAAATGVLAKQLEAGAPGDVFVGAAAEPMTALQNEGLLGPSRIIARNALVLAVPSNSTATLTSLAELRAPMWKRIGIGKSKLVPAGDYALQSLERLGLRAELEPRFISGESVTQVLTWLRSGDLDAGFIYTSDAASAPKEVRVLLTVDERLHAPIVYPAAVVKRSTQAALAQAYVDFLAGPGQTALHAAGLLPP